MKITEITPQKKHLTRIGFEDEKFILIDSDLCCTLCLKVGSVLEDEQVKEILHRSEYERAKSRALWHLDRSSHTERGIYDKLRRAGFSEQISAEVIARLCELYLLDDAAFAARYTERYIAEGLSRRAVYEKLYSKGVPRDVIKEVLDNATFDEGSAIRTVIEKKYRTKLAAGEYQKVYAALLRRGFSYGDVKDALKRYVKEDF